MAHTNARNAKTKTVKLARQKNVEHLKPKNGLYMFLAAALGALVAIPASLSLVMPLVRSQLAADTASLKHSVVQMLPMANMLTDSSTDQCSQPLSTGTSGSGSNQPMVTAQTAQAHPSYDGGSGAGGNASSGGGNNFTITKIIRGSMFTNDTGTVSNTGPHSNNQVSFMNTNTTNVENNNWLQVQSNNSQTAESGNSRVSDNTTGGSATSGTASNQSNTTFTFAVKN